MIEANFRFNNVHCDAFNCFFVADYMPVASAATVNTQEIAGQHGTVRYRGKWFLERRWDGRLYILDEDGECIDYDETMSRAARVAAWLCTDGRKQLVLDAQPDRYYVAEVIDELTVSADGWGNGIIQVPFTLQPFAYALRADSVSGSVAANTATTLCIPSVRGALPALLSCTITAQEALSEVVITASGNDISFNGMSLNSGDKITLSYDTYNGELVAITVGGDAGLAFLAPSSELPLTVIPGRNVPVNVIANGACKVDLSATGRWH